MSDPREESWAASPEDEESPIEAAENPDAKSPEPETPRKEKGENAS